MSEDFYSYSTALAAVDAARIALDDWLNTYASELCDEKRVAEANKRIGEYGTLGYIAHVQAGLRDAIAVLKRCHGPKGGQETGCEKHTDFRSSGPFCPVCLGNERDAYRAALERIVSGVPAHDDHNGLYVAHFDGDGNEVGIEQVDPMAVIGSILGVATAALNGTHATNDRQEKA